MGNTFHLLFQSLLKSLLSPKGKENDQGPAIFRAGLPLKPFYCFL